MHKPYFAKYIPQKGEIKDSTKVMFKINNQWTEPCDFDSFLGPQIQEVAQGILCLCSEDIQVGDKVMEDGEYKELEWTVMMDSCLHSDKVFKVLAPISEGALSYVKAGNRFTRNDILVKEWGGSSIRKPIEFATITEDSYILIKGPDGKFH